MSAPRAIEVCRVHGGEGERVAAPLAEAIDALGREALGDTRFDIRDDLAKPWTRLFLAANAEGDDDGLAGFLSGWHVADELQIHYVATDASLRRRGVGRALVAAALAYARAHRVRIVLLEVRRSNASAIGLYRALGFRVLQVRRGYYADEGEDAVEMIVVLDPTSGAIVPGADEITLDE